MPELTLSPRDFGFGFRSGLQEDLYYVSPRSSYNNKKVVIFGMRQLVLTG
jgi:hypothetical protein